MRNKPPRTKSPRFLFQENGLITASPHPWIKNPRFWRSLNKLVLILGLGLVVGSLYFWGRFFPHQGGNLLSPQKKDLTIPSPTPSYPLVNVSEVKLGKESDLAQELELVRPEVSDDDFTQLDFLVESLR